MLDSLERKKLEQVSMGDRTGDLELRAESANCLVEIGVSHAAARVSLEVDHDMVTGTVTVRLVLVLVVLSFKFKFRISLVYELSLQLCQWTSPKKNLPVGNKLAKKQSRHPKL